MKMFLLMKSNIRKNRSSSITLVILILLSVVMLYSSLMILFDLDGVVDSVNSKNNGADYITLIPKDKVEMVKEKLSSMEHYKSCEVENVVSDYGTIQNRRVEKSAQNMGLIFLDEDKYRAISKANVVDASKKRTKDSILVPYSLKSTYHYRTGDEIEITINGGTKTFTICGFIQDVLFSTAMNIDTYIFYLGEDEFQSFYREAPENEQKSYIKVRLEKGASTAEFDSQFVKETLKAKGLDPSRILQLDYDRMKIGTTTMIKIIAMILIAFAILVIVISLVVIRFTIMTNIEEDIKNIGSMEAAGFTSKMMQRVLVYQFLLLTGLGFVIGISIALSVSGAFTKLVSSTIGMRWDAQLSVMSLTLTFAVIVSFVVLIAVKASGRLKKITPIVALRNGLSTYSFKKNYFPLEQTTGHLDFILGLKQMFHARRQNTSICLIGMIMSFTIVASLTIFNNFTGENSKMIAMIGLEKSNISITCQSDEECKEVTQKLKEYSQIRKVNRVGYSDVALRFKDNEITTSCQICEDFSKLEVSTLAEGRMPRQKNEIALSYMNAKKLNVNMGEVVTLEGKEGNFEYIVVGFTQHINHLGCTCSLTAEGMIRSNEEYFQNMVYVYTKQDVKVKEFLKVLENDLGHGTKSYINMDEAFTNTLQSVRDVCEILCTLLICVAIVVIAIILFYIVKVKITRDKVLIGIQKAIGFTTKQLLVQNVISFCLPLFVSYVIGGLVLIAFSSPLCTLMFSVCDFKRCTLNLSGISVIMTVALLSLFSIMVTVCVSLRIRKINPRELFVD